MTDSTGDSYRLGLDLGTNSIGWAAVLLDEVGEPTGVLGMGARIFPDGRNPTDGSSLAVDRRLARGQRRRRDRYLKRRAGLLKLLIDYGLMPAEKAERDKVATLDPYELRAKALDGPLHPHELGRALFHLNQRRGFKSNRKAGPDENEAAKTREEMDTLAGRIKESGARTLGEFLAGRRERNETVRARTPFGAGAETDRNRTGLYPNRKMYEDEFDAIRDAQKPHQDLSGKQWDALRCVIFHQRPLKPVDPGWCRFEDGEKRAAKALPVAQEFRMLQEVNNLKFRVNNGPECRLTEEKWEQARERALDRLRSGTDITLVESNKAKPPPRSLGLPLGARFNLAAGGRKKVEGDKTAARLMKTQAKRGEKAQEIFGGGWLKRSLDERNEIVRFLLDTEEPEEVKRKAMADWGLDEAQAERAAHAGLPDGYANLSEKAIRKILPHLEQGLVYADAVVAAGYAHHSDFREGEAHDCLPYYGQVLERDVVGADSTVDPAKDGEPARYGRIGNPTVHIGLGQLRRVVNRLIQVHGKPQDIVVELARDLKLNKEQKRKLEREQREGGQRNDRFRQWLESARKDVTAHTLRKLRLWEEQGKICPYTGTTISFKMAVDDRTEIDHILPRSKTLDDSMANKVLCTVEANRAKGDRSPHEAFGHSPPGYDYEQILTRADRIQGNKRWRFDEDAMKNFEDEEKFLDRQLAETRYLSRTARAYLAHLYDETTPDATTGHKQRVRVIPGRMTAILRRGWGLEGMLREGGATGKQRDDHRHHAIDAFVVANTTQGLLQRFMRETASSDDGAEERMEAIARDVTPWHGFDRKDLKPFLDDLVVSYKPDRGTPGAKGKTTGQLHNETAYGLIELAEEGPSTVVVRKKLSAFKKRTDVEAVRDSTMRAALLKLWNAVEAEIEGKDDKKVAAEFAQRAADPGIPRDGGRQPVRRVRVVERQTVIPINDKDGEPYKGYLPGKNEFADVWRMRDGSWRTVVVPTFDANQPGFDIERFRPTDKKSGRADPAAKRLMRLQQNDMAAFGEGDDLHIVRVRKITNDAKAGVLVFLDDHNEANVDARVRKKEMPTGVCSAQQLQKRGFRKVRVDEIGRVVWDPGPRA